jgi:Asp-tRNA(Asn)/Glu-tRNA(Gln) amidotransferase B subunit
MSRKLVTSLAMLAAVAFAASADAHEYRYFNGSDRVYYQRYDRELERVQEPHFHLARAERAFAKGHRSYAADNLEQAAAGFDYFSERAAGEDRRQLDLASRALVKLARDVRRGDVDELTTLERALSDARRVLAGEAVMVTPPAAPAQP